MQIEKALRWIALAGVFALPFVVFVVIHTLFFPFITGKNFAFRILVELIAGAWLGLALLNAAYRPRRSWILAAFALFVVVIALADAFGAYPFKSFWSNYERMDGWITLAHIFIYVVVASSILSTEKLWRTFWQTSFAVATTVGVYALLQLTGVAGLNPGFSGADRLDATFGNPIYLAVYMLFHAFMAAFFVAREWATKTSAISSRAAYLIAAALQVSALYVTQKIFEASSVKGIIALGVLSIVIWACAFLSTKTNASRILLALLVPFYAIILALTGTRGTILGLAGGTLLSLALFILFGKSYPAKARRIAAGAIAVVMLFAGGIYFLKDQAWVQRTPVLGRLATISLEDKTTQARIMNWGMAWEGAKERPILGWGQENYAIVFNKYYNPNMYDQEQWFDRVHNVIFDWLVAGGFLGLAAYLSLFAATLWCLWRKRLGEGAFTLVESSILTGLIGAYFIHNLFVFDNLFSHLLFASVLAYIVFRADIVSGATRLFSSLTLSSIARPIAVGCAIGIAFGAGWAVNASAISANKALLQGLAPQAEGGSKNLEYFNKALSYNSLGTQEVREQLMQAAAQAAQANIPVELKEEFLDAAAQGLLRQAEDSPFDPRPLFLLGALLDTYGLHADAKEALDRAQALSPNKQSILFQSGVNAILRGEEGEALLLFKKAYELAPESSEALSLYTAAALSAGEEALVKELLARFTASGARPDSRILSILVSEGRFAEIAQMFEAYVEKNPTDVEAVVSYAAVLYESGSRSSAIQVLEELKQSTSNSIDLIDSVLTQMQSGTFSID